MPRRRPSRAPATRPGARRPMSRSNRAAIGGKTPPCAEALIAAGVRRVVASVEDPDPRVAGGGLARLREAGIAVESGLCAEEAAEINAGFFQRVRAGRPLVTLKLATSLDGRIATASGESRWITGPAARERTHLLRATHDAILVGTATVLADDPQLTCRLQGLEHRSPVRVALDRNLVIPHDARLVAEARQVPTWFITAPGSDPERREALRAPASRSSTRRRTRPGRSILRDALRRLGERGLTRLLVEGGGRLAAVVAARRSGGPARLAACAAAARRRRRCRRSTRSVSTRWPRRRGSTCCRARRSARTCFRHIGCRTRGKSRWRIGRRAPSLGRCLPELSPMSAGCAGCAALPGRTAASICRSRPPTTRPESCSAPRSPARACA